MTRVKQEKSNITYKASFSMWYSDQDEESEHVTYKQMALFLLSHAN